MKRAQAIDRHNAIFVTLVSTWLCSFAAAQDVRPHAGMMRYPDVSATHVVFVYANDLWLVPREGGVAAPLASPPGEEAFPRFSPDGKTIAFVGNYDGNRDIYTIPVTGGVPRRITFHPDAEGMCDWTPDGRILFNSVAMSGLGRYRQLYTVSASGGLPEQIPVPYGASAAISPNGEWLAYTPHSIDFRTWKRYRGGMQTDIWLFNLKTKQSKQMTDWEGTDSLPMWHGDVVYYLSDQGPEHRGNIWKYDTKSGDRKQVTKFTADDVKWPSIGPDGTMILQNGAQLYLLNLKDEKTTALEISIPGARPKLRPRSVDLGGSIGAWDCSPTGARVVVESRGEIWTAPAQKGTPRNLTRSDGSAERDPGWSPDGRWIAYFSDKTGEYELYVTQSDGQGETRQLTKDGTPWKFNPSWSPNSKRIVFGDKTGAMFIYDMDKGELKHIDTDPWGTLTGGSWTQDSRWLAYEKGGENRQSSIWIYDAEGGEKTQVTSGVFNDSSPAFDRKGDYLYFVRNIDFTSPQYEDLGTTFVYRETGRLMLAPLRDDIASPYAPKSDEEKWGDDKDKKDAKPDEKKSDKNDSGKPDESAAGKSDAKEGDTASSKPADDTAKAADGEKSAEGKDEKKDEKKDDKPKPVEIDLAGLDRRAIMLPPGRGNYTGLGVTEKGHLLYVKFGDGNASLRIFDVADEEKKEKTVIDNMNGYSLSADGKKIALRRGGTIAVVDASADQKLDKAIDFSAMKAEIDPRAEWKQIFNDAWRIQRDFFYDPNMHGVDWKAIREHYARMLADAVSREDISFIIREMISELNVGHAYYSGGDEESQPSVSVGMLGCDFEIDQGAYRIKRILTGAAWDADARGPLSQPGVKVKAGDYLLAVNGVALDSSRAPWSAFQGLAGKTVTITVSERPTRDDSARDVVVELIGSEANLRYRDWIESKRAYVEKKTDGKVGYIYVPDTGVNGQNNLFRQFYGQMDKAALIIDERWNGGGQIPTRFIELLNRPVTNYWARRDGNDWTWPPDSHPGPKCMLINGLAGSGGDMFPWLFRHNKLGKLIGTRTWGGLVGISGNPGLIDGGNVTAPTFAFYEKDGTWGVEGHGVDPDIEVIDDPAKMLDGGDPQLDAAIELMLKEIRENGYKAPQRPKYPDRRGMGLPDSDK